MQAQSYIPFTKEMKKEYTILMPTMLPRHFELIGSVLGTYGYKMELLKTAGQKVVDAGLRYVHNDACYPAVLVIGQFLEAITSGRYDPHKVALILFQTGGGCRASNYISLLRKALARAGYDYVPVISFSLAGLEHHPGFTLGVSEYHGMAYAVLYGDLLLTLVRDDLAALEQLEERITNLEQEVLADNTDRFIHRMSAIRKEVSRADRFYAQLADFGASLLEEADDLFDKRSTRRMNYFLRRVEALKNETERLREYAMQVSGEYQSQVDIAQNRVMQLLTIVTTIFLPLSLIVGWYGMNFDMPELSWEYGYPVVIVLAVVIVAVLIRYFKRKKWF